MRSSTKSPRSSATQGLTAGRPRSTGRNARAMSVRYRRASDGQPRSPWPTATRRSRPQPRRRTVARLSTRVRFPSSALRPGVSVPQQQTWPRALAIGTGVARGPTRICRVCLAPPKLRPGDNARQRLPWCSCTKRAITFASSAGWVSGARWSRPGRVVVAERPFRDGRKFVGEEVRRVVDRAPGVRPCPAVPEAPPDASPRTCPKEDVERTTLRNRLRSPASAARVVDTGRGGTFPGHTNSPTGCCLLGSAARSSRFHVEGPCGGSGVGQLSCQVCSWRTGCGRLEW